MDRVKAANTVAFASRDVAPGGGTPQYFTNGVPGSVPATILPGYFLNMLEDELLQVIADAGIAFNDGDWTQLSQAIRFLASQVNRTQVFFASGTFTVPARVTSAEPEVWGGSGAGGASGDGSGGGVVGNAGGGGGAGGYAKKRIAGLTPGTPIAVTVGAAGIAGMNAAGSAGGTSSFAGYCSATGGGGGPRGTATLGNGGLGGTGTGGDINIPGGTGGFSGSNDLTFSASYFYDFFLKGGLPALGVGTVPWDGSGGPGAGFAAGGSGASGGSGIAGGAGSPGLVIVRW